MDRYDIKLLGVYADAILFIPMLCQMNWLKLIVLPHWQKDSGQNILFWAVGLFVPPEYRTAIINCWRMVLINGCRSPKHDLIPSYHPHLGSLAEKPEQIHKLFSLTDISFCPDIAHLAAGGGDALELIKQYYDRIRYIHLKDLSDKGEFVPLGKGHIGIDAIVDFLLKKGYKGDWLVEIDGYSGDPDEACATSYTFLKKLLI